MRRSILYPTVTILALAACPGNPIQINAQFLFLTPDFKRQQPAAMVDVQLLANGNVVGRDTTDMDGKASFTFTSDPGRLTYQVRLSNAGLTFSLASCGGPPAQFQGTVLESFDTTSSVRVGVPTADFSATMAWTYLNKATNIANAIPQFHMFFINACTGVMSFFNKANQTITVNLKSGGGLDETLYHEYGHAVMYQANGGPYDNTNCIPHYMGQTENVNCAWIEGWANFFAVYVNSILTPAGDTTFQGRQIERYTSPVVGDSGYRDEGRVTAALWDLYDGSDDANFSSDPGLGLPGCGDGNQGNQVSLSQMLGSMKLGDPNPNLRNFWQQLRFALSPQQRAFASIVLSYNWIPRGATCAAERP